MSASRLKLRLSEKFPFLISGLKAALLAGRSAEHLPVRPFGPGQHREIQLELQFPRRHRELQPPW